MLKFIIAAVWIAAVSIGSVMYSFQAAQSRPEAPEIKPAFGGLQSVKTEIISVPLLKQSRVYGYFLTRLIYTVEPAKLAKLSIPAPALLTDAVYTHLYGNPTIDFSVTETLDLEALRNGLRAAINARVGDEFVHDILVEQIDFLSKEEIRDNTVRRHMAGQEAAEARKTAAH